MLCCRISKLLKPVLSVSTSKTAFCNASTSRAVFRKVSISSIASLTDSFSDRPPGKSELTTLLMLPTVVALTVLVLLVLLVLLEEPLVVAVTEVEVAALESDRDVEDGEWPEELELLKSNSFTTAVPVIAFLSFTCSLNNTCSTKAPMDHPKFRSIVAIITQLQNQLQKKNITKKNTAFQSYRGVFRRDRILVLQLAKLFRLRNRFIAVEQMTCHNTWTITRRGRRSFEAACIHASSDSC